MLGAAAVAAFAAAGEGAGAVPAGRPAIAASASSVVTKCGASRFWLPFGHCRLKVACLQGVEVQHDKQRMTWTHVCSSRRVLCSSVPPKPRDSEGWHSTGDNIYLTLKTAGLST